MRTSRNAISTTPATGLATLVCLILSLASSTAQPVLSGEDAARIIDWTSVQVGAPIPDLMPAAQSDDPLETGFAPQWIEHAVFPFPSSASAWGRKLALEIVARRRSPDDYWAATMEEELREIVRTKLPASRNARVFCNSAGCLCYVERDEPFVARSIVYLELLGETGRKYGVDKYNLGVLVHVGRSPGIPWELTLVRHPSADTPVNPSQTPNGVLTVTPNNRWSGP